MTRFLAVVLAILVAACQGQSLATIEHGGTGPPTLVLLHGYGSRAEEWVPFVNTIALPPGGRYVFPQGPDSTLPPDGPFGGRAWWRLGLAEHLRADGMLPDLSSTRPVGLEQSAGRVTALLQRLRSVNGRPIMLGGYSQGAMVASQVAFRSDEPLDALILLSGTTVNESAWQAGLTRRQGLPVFVAHGRSDPTLPFSSSVRLKDALIAAGAQVTWHPFEGAHEIPAEVVIALNRFLEQMTGGQLLGPKDGR